MEIVGSVPGHIALPKTDAENRLPFVKVDPLKVKPLDCRLVVRKIMQGNRTDGGIYLPHGDKQRALTMMEVVSVGDGRTTDHGVHIKVRVKPGDVVLVGKYAGNPLDANEDYKIINEVEILGVQER